MIAELFQWLTRVSSDAIAIAFECFAAIGAFLGTIPHAALLAWIRSTPCDLSEKVTSNYFAAGAKSWFG
jgi:hypothetical protein